jgi:hypothetical protein
MAGVVLHVAQGGTGVQGASLVPVQAHRGGIVRIEHRAGHALGGTRPIRSWAAQYR